ncbi:MAG: hypothetical protein WD638_08600 [Nitriliruptoraceae bacterium]
MGVNVDDPPDPVGIASVGRPLPLAYTVALANVLVAATAYGLLAEGAYPAPAGVPLVRGALRARAGSLAGHVIWLSVCGYTTYTNLMYVVAPYNDALLLHIAAIGLATLWLTTILSVWPGGLPDDLIVYDLPSAVHVLDLAFMLPVVGASGVLLLRGHGIAPVLWGAITAILAAWLFVISRRYRPAAGAWLRPRIWETVPNRQPGGTACGHGSDL